MPRSRRELRAELQLDDVLDVDEDDVEELEVVDEADELLDEEEDVVGRKHSCWMM